MPAILVVATPPYFGRGHTESRPAAQSGILAGATASIGKHNPISSYNPNWS
jgi:hypothetical protein